MFEHLAKYKKIFVTGPNRTGTTIAARMVANDTGHDLVLEDEFTCSNRVQFSAFLHAGHGPMVIQCPFFAHEIHDLQYLYDIDMAECLVVFMHRYRPDIITSEQNARAKVDFTMVARGQMRAYNVHATGAIHMSDLKYDAWQDQCQVIPNAMDLAYESLHPHWMWNADHRQLGFQHHVNQLAPSEHMTNAVRTISNG